MRKTARTQKCPQANPYFLLSNKLAHFRFAEDRGRSLAGREKKQGLEKGRKEEVGETFSVLARRGARNCISSVALGKGIYYLYFMK